MYSLFNGSKDSPIYNQLLKSYEIYRFIVRKRNENIENDFINYADELISYGIYKLEKDFEVAYFDICNSIKDIIDEEKKFLEGKNLTYSHNGYFKSANSRYDLNKKMDFIEKNEAQ